MADEEFKGADTAAPSGDGGASNPWHHDLDSDAKGWLATKGWDKLDAKQAVTEAVKAYRGAEKLVGGDPASLLRQPRPDATPAEINAFWSRLGAHETADKYDFSGIKHADGNPLDPDFATFLRNTAAELHLPASAATEIAARFAKMADAAEAQEADVSTRALAEAKAQLATNWGGDGSPQYRTNLAVAQRAALTSGVTQEELNAIEQTLGYPKIMQAFLKLGVGMGEHKALTGGGGTSMNEDGTPKPMSVEEARSKIASLKMDSAWRDRWAKGGVKEANELQDAIDKIVHSGQRV